jgi:dipeptidyl aminopeptidase/acylaminoacyl peptidase
MQSVMRIGAWVALILFGVLLAGCAAAYSLQNEFVFPNAAEGPMDRPPPPGAIQHWLETPDGARVKSWLFLPKAASAAAKAPAIIFFHGNSDYIETKLEYPEFYTARGIACLIVEYRGYRRSTGAPSEAALSADAAAFFDWLAARPEIDASRIGAHGHSLGAAIAARLAVDRPVKTLVMVSAFRSLPALFGRYYLPGALARERFDNEAAVAAFAGRILLLHGESDEIVPVRHGRRLAEIAGENAQLILYPGVDHDVPWDWRVFGRDLMDFYAAAGLAASRTTP